jgi:hypothetical protein
MFGWRTRVNDFWTMVLWHVYDLKRGRTFLVFPVIPYRGKPHERSPLERQGRNVYELVSNE